MKLLIGLVLCSFAVLVATEQCITVSGCNHVTCDAGHDLECHNLQCTCSDTSQSCSAASTCTGNCRFGWHCVDGTCRCGFGIGLPGIGK